ncbi:MAG: formimidoylglutamate deiminase [Gammaproteobacteria bacterium]|nr:formimidoylglutamate deiminase [Gammaproteobacteria bacterium]MBT8111773.1 formimidoylglutamate deiminase [Gammaproteobacteria bacterium]NND47171.1 formimidoylglutamate deiminase [Woeseiaceae bacterium]NNL46472.1 formimidoylglutamate deiminase [Woeseiaceae bacterium]
MNHVFASKALLPDGWADNVRLGIDQGLIDNIAVAAKPSSGDTLAGCVIPGLCNAHSHAFQRALAGHTEQRSPTGHDSFWTWRERMYELAGQVDAPALTAIARQVYCEMLSSGYTAVAEFHYLHRDPRDPQKQDAMLQAIVQAATDSGIRLTCIPVLYERAGFNDPEPAAHQRNFAMSLDEFLAHYARAADYGSESVTIGIGAHSLRAVSHESLAEIARVAADSDAPMHLHIAEQQREVDQCMAAYGRRPVRWLLENLDVTERWSLVHATHMDFDETAALADSGAVAVLCPSTEANLGDGLFPLHHFLEEGGRIAIGSDSHVSINPFEELRWLEYGQRLATQSRNVVSLRHSHVGSELFSRVLEGGAMAGGQSKVGLEKGAPADLVVLGDDDPMLAGHGDDSRLDALVFSGYPLPVERVMVNGDWRVVDAVHVDRERARVEYAATLKAFGKQR